MTLSTGAYELTLNDNVLHAGGPNQENAVDPTTSLGYVVTDADGSPIGGTLTITFDDDAPTATNEPAQSVGEGGTINGTVDFVAGADGASVTHVNGTTLVFGGDDYSQSVDIGNGSIKVKADGTYVFTADNPVIGNGSANASFTITDGDNDTATATAAFTITDVNKPTGGTTLASLDDDGIGGNAVSTVDDLAVPNVDGDNNEATFAGTLTHDFGLDGAGTVSFAALHGTTGQVGTETVSYAWSEAAGVGTLTATGPRGLLFTLDVTLSTGAYELTLNDNVLHAGGPNQENAVDPTTSLGYVVTDADGSPIGGTLTITFDDDAPTATNEPAQSVGEGGTINGTVDFVAGADGASVTHVNGTTLVFGGDDYSQSVDIGNGSIKVKADGTYVFTADNPVIGNGSANASFTITDGDNDTATATAAFTITDVNKPTGGTTLASLDDDGIGGNAVSTVDDLAVPNVDGDNNEATFAGTLTHDFGLDGAGTVSFAALHGTTGQVGTETVSYAWSEAAGVGTLTATGPRGLLFTLDVTLSTGAYELTLNDNVLHAGGPNQENAVDPTTSLGYVVTDADGSPIGGTLTITFDDDAPTATNEPAQSVGEGGTINGTVDFVAGADGASVTHVNGTTLVFGGDDYSQSVDIGNGSIKVKADGTYVFTADNPVIGNGSANASFTITDGDNDTATATAAFTITDVNKPTGGTTLASLDDDGIGGNAVSTVDDLAVPNVDGDNNEATFAGTLTHDFGLDGAGTVSFAALHGTTGQVGTETVSYAWSEAAGVGTLTATGPRGLLFTLDVTLSTGAYELTLNDNVLHAGGPNQENAVDPTTSLGYVVTDADGSPIGGTLTITFDDDAPTATNEPAQSVGEGGTINGTVDFVAGADGASVTHVNGTTLVFGGDDYSQSVDIGNGSIKVKADGTYVFTADNPVIGNGSANASFTITDGDNDTATATAAFTITDVNKPTGGTTLASLDDDGIGAMRWPVDDLAVPNVDGDNNEATFAGTLTHDFGLDGAGTVSFAALHGTTGQVGTETVSYAWSEAAGVGTLTATGPRGLLFTLDVTLSTGAYELTLNDNVLHAGGPNQENAVDPTTSLGYVVTDADGSPIGGTLTITFDDDAPTATNEPAQSVGEGGTINGTVDFVAGADGASVTHVNGTTLVFGGDDYSQSVDIGNGSIKVKADGTYVFTADNPVIGNGSANASFTITDGDNDTATATAAFTITDVNKPTGGTTLASLDDDGIGGNAVSTVDDLAVPNVDGDNNEATFAGTLTHDFGLDGAGTVSFAALHGTTGQVGTETVSYAWSEAAGVGTLTATGPRGLLFTLDVTLSTGAYELTLNDNVLHAGGPNQENAVDPTTSLGYVVTDADGSPIGGTLTITFDDDAPSLVGTPTNVTLSGLSGTGNFGFVIGADKTSTDDLTSYLNVSITGTVSGVAITNVQVVANNAASTSALAYYDITFDYRPNPASAATAPAKGTLTFDGTNYTITLANPIQSFTTTSGVDSLIEYDAPGMGGGSPEIVVAQLETDFFVKFTGGGGNTALTTVNAPAGALAAGDLFTNTTTSVLVSSVAIGVGGNTIGKDEVIDFNFYSTVPNATPGSGTPTTASAMYIKMDGIGSEDLVVVLKLVNPTNPADTTTRAIIVQNADIYKSGETLPAGFTGISLDSNDGLLIIDEFDYRTGTENYVISGAQIVSSVSGISGSGVNLIRAPGSAGASDPASLVAFTAADTDQDIIKILDIGFAQTNRGTLQLDIAVAAKDQDGDVTTTTHLLVNPATPPVVLDLDGDGTEFLSMAAGVAFDYAGDGNPESTAWVGADDGLLAIDNNANGKVDNGTEIVFGGNGLTDLQGLAANYDSNKDGVLDASDTEFAKFGVWQDANSNGVTDAGEFQSLAAAGIASINLVSDGKPYLAAGGDVTVHGTSSYAKADGSTGLVADASFAIGAAQTQQREQVQANTLVAASLVALAGADILLQDAAAGAARESLVSRELDVDTVSQAASQPYQADGIEQPTLSAQDLLKVETVELVQHDDMPTTQLWDANRFDQQERFDIDQADFNQAAAEPIVHDALSMLSMPVEIGSMEALLIAHTASNGAVEVQTAALQEVIADTLNDNGIDHLLDQLTGPAEGPLLGANDAFGGSEDFAAALIDMPVNADSFAHFSSITVSDQLQEMATSHA